MGWVTLQTTLYTMYMCFQAAPMGQTCFPAKNNLSPWKQGTGQEATPPFPFSYFWTHISPFRNLTCFGGVHLLHLLGRYLPVTKILKSSICPQSWLHYTNASDIQTLNFDLTKVRYIWWISQTSLTMRNRKRQVWSHMDIFVVKQHGHLFCKNIFYHMFIYIYIYIDHICI